MAEAINWTNKTRFSLMFQNNLKSCQCEGFSGNYTAIHIYSTVLLIELKIRWLVKSLKILKDILGSRGRHERFLGKTSVVCIRLYYCTFWKFLIMTVSVSVKKKGWCSGVFKGFTWFIILPSGNVTYSGINQNSFITEWVTLFPKGQIAQCQIFWAFTRLLNHLYFVLL